MKKALTFLLTLALLAACQTPSRKASYIVQVSLGTWDQPAYTAESIVSRIDSVASLIPVEKVIIGWSTDKDIYRKVGEYLHAKDIKMLLWLPVFAETEGVCESQPALDLWGRSSGNFDLTAGEGFSFNCPSVKSNRDQVLAIYDNLFSDCGFDGVFMDRVRGQSFVGGAAGVLSCGCPVCTARFLEEGIDLEQVKNEVDVVGDAFFSVDGYSPETGFRFSNKTASAFFKAKGHIVSGAVAALCDSLHARGLEVGLDLYAPFMAPFVGQDYEILTAHADFIKPMLYRKTNAPAGMGFEYGLLKNAVPNAQGYPVFEMDVDFLESQLKAMEPYSCGKYPGIEINYRPDIALTSPEYVRESLDAIMAHGFEGAVLSWNIMEAPEPHIACLSD
ncbi:MAG: hypothetical protein K5843_02715 [Bacteroidales bacterium]|nr:hypothetical protein [Bacteroidales bacterium]